MTNFSPLLLFGQKKKSEKFSQVLNSDGRNRLKIRVFVISGPLDTFVDMETCFAFIWYYLCSNCTFYSLNLIKKTLKN